MEKTIHTIQVRCDNCSKPHLTKEGDLIENGNKKVQVCYSSGDIFDDDWRNPNRNGSPMKSIKKTEKKNIDNMGKILYQKKQIQVEKKPDLGSIMNRFIEASEKRHDNTYATL